MMKKIISLSFLLALSSQAFAGPEYIPVVSGILTTGQYNYQKGNASTGGNLGITFIPALKYSDSFSLIPNIDTMYQGILSAQELAGGNTLFQDSWDSGLGLKAVHTLSENWKLKERMGIRNKWVRETTDEEWGDGLYD